MQHLDSFIDVLPAVLWEMQNTPGSAKQQLLYINSYAEELFGYPLDDWFSAGNFWLKICHPDDKAAAVLQSTQVKEKEEITFTEFRCLKKNGEIVWLETRSLPVRNDAGTITGIRAVTINVSARKLLEQEERSLSKQASENSEATLRHLAFHDALTGLPNRLLLRDRLHVSLHHAKRKGEPVGVMFVDLDRFKGINDTLGHQAGDIVLKEVARRLQSCVREEDTVARFGGDEFVVVLSDISSVESITEVADKILNVLTPAILLNEQEVHLSASIGISTYPNDGDTAEQLLKNADNALYQAKEAGKNIYKVYTPAMHLKVSAKMLLENGLRKAIERKELVVYLQPIAQLTTKKLVAAEALLRWKHPTNTLIMPEEFIPLAEETGLIISISEWLVEYMVDEIVRWQKKGIEVPTISLNISPRQFREDSFIEWIIREVGKRGLSPSSLQLELTESLAMENISKSIMKLRQLKEAGFYLAIDDFGSGYSSLSYLKQLPVDVLKIDKSFAKESSLNLRSQAVIQAIITLGHTLGLSLCAEGIEAEEEYDFYAQCGCDTVQGFYISPPQPVAAFANLLLHSQEKTSA